MLNLAAHRKDRTVAIVAAMILLLQAFFMAWTSGAMASGAMPVDAWGNPLCIASTDDGSPPDGGIKLPNCCAIGCGVSATVLSEPVADVIPLRVEGSGAPVRVEFAYSGPPSRSGHDPGSPRAPPLPV